MTESNKYPISASQVKLWKDCPKQFWYRYISDFEVSDDGNKYTEMGNAVHESIEEYLSGGHTLDDRDKIQRGLQIELAKRQDDFDYGEDMEERAQDCLESAAVYIEKFVDKDSILGIEDDITFSVDEIGIGNRDFRAIIDLAVDGRIVDWKTGNQRPEKVQAAIYIAAYHDKYGKIPEEVHFVYLKDGDVNFHKAEKDDKTYWSEDYSEYWEDMMVIARSMQNGIEMGQFPADPGESKCYWCDYSYHCPDSGFGVGNIPWDAFR